MRSSLVSKPGEPPADGAAICFSRRSRVLETIVPDCTYAPLVVTYSSPTLLNKELALASDFTARCSTCATLIDTAHRLIHGL